MDRAALDAAYNNTAAVGAAKRAQYVADWMKRSDVIRRTPGARIDLRYGNGARHRVDVFACGRPAATPARAHARPRAPGTAHLRCRLGDSSWATA